MKISEVVTLDDLMDFCDERSLSVKMKRRQNLVEFIFTDKESQVKGVLIIEQEQQTERVQKQ